MKNYLNIVLIAVGLVLLVMGCSGGGANKGTASSSPAANTANAGNVGIVEEKPIAIDAKALTKEYDANELSADGKYKGKQLAVTGKISNIAETLGNITVQMEGQKIMPGVICSFEDSEKSSVMALKKGQQVTMIGTGDGSTAGLYIGLKKCKIK